MWRTFIVILLLLLWSDGWAAAKPTLWIIGDSTVNNSTAGQRGWGQELLPYFDLEKIAIENRARGGRSSRTFLSEGLWTEVLAKIKEGDFVLMQFGHNDGGKVGGELSPGRPARASLPGNGEGTEEVEMGNPAQKEVVHSYGWYLRKYIADTKAKGATPIVCSLVPRNDWKDGKVLRATSGYGKWAAEAAQQAGAFYVDLNAIIADRYDQLGEAKVKEFFPQEHTHQNPAGANFNARSLICGLNELPDSRLREFLSLQGREAADEQPRSGSSPAKAQRQREKLSRGVVAIRQSAGQVFVSWRLLGLDSPAVAFNVYRSIDGAEPMKLNLAPLTGPTYFIDLDAKFDKPVAYTVRAVVSQVEQEASAPFLMPANAPVRPYLSLPLQTPKGYTPNDAAVADLDGDGDYEIILHQAGRGRDNSQRGETDPPIIQAYRLDGTLLWTIRLGKNIREGAHYTQFIAYDLDGDGKAEFVCKTADGTIDGRGKVIGDPKADHRNAGGYILRGPEYLTVFDGLTGAELATTKYIPGRHPRTENPTPAELKEVWGDDFGNRCDRFLACVAFLDGHLPSVVMCRGYYTRTVLAAWNWRDHQLTNVWTFDSAAGPLENRKFAGQGNHNLTVADVDGDGKDEIIYGGMAIDDDGKGLYSTGLGHGDALHVSDLDPARPGLEVFRIQERFDDAGAHMFDARTGEVLWKKPSVKAATSGGDKGEGPGRGLAMDIDPRYPGAECWAVGAGITGLFDAQGGLIQKKCPPSCNFGVWWDGDLLREILDHNWIAKWNWEKSTLDRLLTADGCAASNGTKATPCLSADIFGDWREEVIWRTADNRELRICTTTIPTPHRLTTLMHDPQYRLSVAWQNVGYNQPPHPGFFLGEGMTNLNK